MTLGDCLSLDSLGPCLGLQLLADVRWFVHALVGPGGLELVLLPPEVVAHLADHDHHADGPTDSDSEPPQQRFDEPQLQPPQVEQPDDRVQHLEVADETTAWRR